MSNFNEINEDEVFEKKKKSKIMEKFSKHKKKIGIVCCIIIIIAVLAVLYFTGILSNLFTRNQIGNTIGNITNCGYAVEKDNYIYYVSPSDDMYTTTISRLQAGSSEGEVIYTGAYDVRALNIVGSKIYFISLAIPEDSEAASNTEIDAKIYKMNLDGSNLTVLNDNDFAYDDYSMYVINNWIYYIGTDSNVYKMDLNGGNRSLVADTQNSCLAINDKYIIYNKENEDGSDYITYIRELNGTEEREINSSRIYTPVIYEDYIYYINSDSKFVKTPVQGGDEEIILEYPIYNINIADGYIYYLNYKDEAAEDYTIVIYKLNIDGGDPETIKEMSSYTSFLDVVNGYAYYMDMDDEKAFINLVKLEDGNTITINEWKYNEELGE